MSQHYNDLNYLKQKIDRINNCDFNVQMVDSQDGIKSQDIHELIACIVPEMVNELIKLREVEQAFCDLMDGNAGSYDIQCNTGLSFKRCKEISYLYQKLFKR